MALRILLLTTDAYGGHGGIAYYNRCLAEALAEMPEVEEVVVLARVMRFAPEGIPEKVRLFRRPRAANCATCAPLLAVGSGTI